MGDEVVFAKRILWALLNVVSFNELASRLWRYTRRASALNKNRILMKIKCSHLIFSRIQSCSSLFSSRIINVSRACKRPAHSLRRCRAFAVRETGCFESIAGVDETLLCVRQKRENVSHCAWETHSPYETLLFIIKKRIWTNKFNTKVGTIYTIWWW